MEGEKHRCRCPFCKESFDVYVAVDMRVHVATQSKGDPTSGTSQRHLAPHEGEERFGQAHDVLRKHAEERREDKMQYPPNVPPERRRDD